MSNKFSKLYTSRAFQNGIASQNILIFVGTSSVDVKKYIPGKMQKKERKKFKILFFWNFPSNQRTISYFIKMKVTWESIATFYSLHMSKGKSYTYKHFKNF